MAESILPVFGAWWRSKGARLGDGATLPAGASATPYDGSAVESGGRRFAFEIAYTAQSATQLDLRVNWFSAEKRKVSGPFSLKSVTLPAGDGVTVTEQMELPENPSPRWLPSIAVPAESSEVAISSLKIYEVVAPSGPSATVWDGEREVACTVTVWDGTKELPATLEVQA